MLDFSLPLIVSTFAIIFLAELPDKTSLASLVLATKYKASHVVAGAWLAFVVQTIVGVFAGSLLHLLPAKPVHIVAGLGFVIFAYLALKRKEEAVESEEEKEVKKETKIGRPAWVTSFLVIFAAEWGDLTQLATAAIVAQSGHPFSVSIGAILALWSVTIIAAFLGSQLSKRLKPEILTVASGVLFAVVGIAIIVSALFQ